jgi:S-DNA-T family DNA segregation ATPase FtsK/SpoIIIE
MLLLDYANPKPKRVQGLFLSDQEIHRVTGWLKKHGQSHYQEDILSYEPEKGMTFGSGESFDDEKFDEAVEIVLNSKRASASLLQRHLRIGYARAARLLDILEEKGLVGPSDGSNRSREILIDKETYARVKLAEEESKNDKDKPQPPSGISSPPPPPPTDSGQPRDFERDIDMGEIDN